MEADGQSSVALVRDDIGGRHEDRLQELARLVLMSLEEGLDETSKRAFRAVGGELDGIHEYLAFPFELYDLLGFEDLFDGHVLGQLCDARGELACFGLALTDELVEFLFADVLFTNSSRLSRDKVQEEWG